MKVLCKNPKCLKFSEINMSDKNHPCYCGHCGGHYGNYCVNLEVLAECKRLSDNYYDMRMWPTLVLSLLIFFVLPMTLLDAYFWGIHLFIVAILVEFLLINLFIFPRMKKKFPHYFDQANS